MLEDAMTTAARREQLPDPTYYPVVEKVPVSNVQRAMENVLWPLVARWLAERGEMAFVSSDQFIYYRQYDPRSAVAPDLYILPGVPPDAGVTAWKVWETGIVPSLAVEIVSTDVRKDYEVGPTRYEELGVEELIVFDPDWQQHAERFRFQVFRRNGPRLPRVKATNADRVRSSVLGCWIRSVGDGVAVRLRLALDPKGDRLYPTDDELRQEAEASLKRERAARKREQAALAAAEVEIARLRRELEKRH